MNSRRKGHNFERKWATFFKKIGYKNCQTSRYASRLLDNCKVDLANIPYFIQLKHDKRKLDYAEIFLEMTQLLKENDVGVDKPRIIIHRIGRKRFQEFAVIPIEEFKTIISGLEDKSRRV